VTFLGEEYQSSRKHKTPFNFNKVVDHYLASLNHIVANTKDVTILSKAKLLLTKYSRGVSHFKSSNFLIDFIGKPMPLLDATGPQITYWVSALPSAPTGPQITYWVSAPRPGGPLDHRLPTGCLLRVPVVPLNLRLPTWCLLLQWGRVLIQLTHYFY
jgi:hypothetical protein